MDEGCDGFAKLVGTSEQQLPVSNNIKTLRPSNSTSTYGNCILPFFVSEPVLHSRFLRRLQPQIGVDRYMWLIELLRIGVVVVCRMVCAC